MGILADTSVGDLMVRLVKRRVEGNGRYSGGRLYS